MVKEVIKRGGKHVPFRPAKITHAIRAAAKEAHLPAMQTKRVVGKVSRAVLKSVAKRKAVTTSVLRKKILSQLEKVEPVVARAWRKHDARRRARRRK